MAYNEACLDEIITTADKSYLLNLKAAAVAYQADATP